MRTLDEILDDFENRGYDQSFIQGWSTCYRELQHLIPEEEMQPGQEVNPNVTAPGPVGAPTPAEYSEVKSNLDPEIKRLRDVGYHVLTDEDLKRYCDNARAYGWEAASSGKGVLQFQYTTSQFNPFTDSNWDADLKIPQGLIVTATENQL